MATVSILTKISLNKKETKRFNEIVRAESPVKDIQPMSMDELKKGEADIKKWLSKSTH